ncbi:MAG: alpha/beta hydrolase [Gemmatimonadales bacterium]
MAIRGNKTVVLQDGRLLGYDECGAADGVPVILFPDVLSSRLGLAGAEQDEVAERLGVRLIAVDRPGIGASTLRAGRSILDWPVDLVGFAEQLGLGRFNLIGIGSATPYVAACAIRIPHRLWAAGIVSGCPHPADDPSDLEPAALRQFGGLTRRLGFLLRRSVRRLAERYATNPGAAVEATIAAQSAVDRSWLGEPTRRQTLIEMGREAFRLGVEGPLTDLRLLFRPWGFSTADVPMVINLWVAELDLDTPAEATRALATEFRRSETRSYPTEGHFTLYPNRLEDILETLLATARREEGRPVA